MSFLSFKPAPPPFESPSFESLFPPNVRETLLTTRLLRHDNACSQPHTSPLGLPPRDPQSNLAHVGSRTLSSGSDLGSSVFGTDIGFLNFCMHAPPPSLTPVLGSLEYGLARKKYTNWWDSWEDFAAWLKNEQVEKTVELRLSKTIYGKPAFKVTFYYLCSRHGTGGLKAYQKQHPD